MPVFNNILAGAAGSGGAADYKIERSLRFSSDDSAHLSKTFSSSGNRRTFTFSCWVKRSSDGSHQTLFQAGTSYFRFYQDGELQYYWNGTQVIYTIAQFRDPSAWYHIVMAVDTTQSTATDRVKFWVNGVSVSTIGTPPTPNFDVSINNASTVHYIGSQANGALALDGYLADVHFIDGQALAATDFGAPDADTGVWNPKAFSGTYNTNGFHLDFSDNSSKAALGTDSSGNSNTWTVSNLAATAPGLSTANQGFNVVTYTGNGSSGRNIEGLSFTPDFVWLKNTTNTGGYNHILVDSVRGAGKYLASNVPNAESTFGYVSAFNSGGFTVSNHTEVNGSSNGYVAWCWKAGGSASSNTDGDITTQVSVNSTYGFSIMTWTSPSSADTNGWTLGHDLPSAPKFILNKNRSSAGNWTVFHTSLGNTKALYLNDSGTGQTNQSLWNNTDPTDSVWSAGSTGWYGTSNDFVTYAWCEIPGFSKFGSFTHASTTSLNLGFKPKFFLIKQTDGTTPWYLFDAERDSFDDPLFPNTDGAAANGFVFTANDTGISWISGSLNSGTYIYAAFADKPNESIIDSLIDTPTNYEADSGNNGGNYATMNPVGQTKTEYFTEDGNLTVGNSSVPSGSSGSRGYVPSTIGFKTGKWYCECVTTRASDGDVDFAIGIFSQDASGYYQNDGTTYNCRPDARLSSPGNLAASYGTAWADGDVIGIAVDLDSSTKTIQWFKNGTATGTAVTISTDHEFFFGYGSDGGGSGRTYKATWNFGQRPFAYTPPTGFKSLCTQNFDDPLIADGSTAFDIDLYTGTGSTHERSNFSFNPDLVWIKNRSSTYEHLLFDSVREATKYIKSNSSAQEQSNASTLSSFDSDGFTLGGDNEINKSSETYCAWAWDAGNAANPTSISAGSLNSSVYDQSQSAWQNYLTTTNSNGFPDSNYPVTLAFDSNLGNHTYTGDNDIYFTPSGGVSFSISSQVRIRSYQNTTVTVETSSATYGPITSSNSGTYQWTTVECSGTLTKITITRSGGANLSGIEIDGKLLVNSGVTPPNVPLIASTVRANPSAGFSICTYTGSTGNQSFGHGLNAAPKFILIKNRSTAANWFAMVDIGTTYLKYGHLNEPDAFGDATAQPVSSSTVTLGNNNAWFGANGDNYVAYCFTPVEGYSAFGSYTGNGSADGPFVFTGFRPAFVLIKNSSAAANWMLYDTARNTFNESPYVLSPNTSDGGLTYDAYSGSYPIDILSNGFKVRSTLSNINGNGNTLVYACFAEHPFKTARAR